MNGVSLRELALHLARHPDKVPVVAVAAWRLRAQNWWRHAPFLPLPDRRYWAFRVVTANGSAGAAMSAAAIVDTATWSSRQRRQH
jgi:hypothetical protein